MLWLLIEKSEMFIWRTWKRPFLEQKLKVVNTCLITTNIGNEEYSKQFPSWFFEHLLLLKQFSHRHLRENFWLKFQLNTVILISLIYPQHKKLKINLISSLKTPWNPLSHLDDGGKDFAEYLMKSLILKQLRNIFHTLSLKISINLLLSLKSQSKSSIAKLKLSKS